MPKQGITTSDASAKQAKLETVRTSLQTTDLTMRCNRVTWPHSCTFVQYILNVFKELVLTCHTGLGRLAARQISPQLLWESQAGQGLGAGTSPTATPPVSRKRNSAGSILPLSTCRPAATPNAKSSLSFSNRDLQHTQAACGKSSAEVRMA